MRRGDAPKAPRLTSRRSSGRGELRAEQVIRAADGCRTRATLRAPRRRFDHILGRDRDRTRGHICALPPRRARNDRRSPARNRDQTRPGRRATRVAGSWPECRAGIPLRTRRDIRRWRQLRRGGLIPDRRRRPARRPSRPVARHRLRRAHQGELQTDQRHLGPHRDRAGDRPASHRTTGSGRRDHRRGPRPRRNPGLADTSPAKRSATGLQPSSAADCETHNQAIPRRPPTRSGASCC
jgi:hypothetical protein